jgi:hypothetical protein
MSPSRQGPQNGPDIPSMPQTEHDQGKIKASSASVKPVNQPATVLRAEAGGEKCSKVRMEQWPA